MSITGDFSLAQISRSKGAVEVSPVTVDPFEFAAIMYEPPPPYHKDISLWGHDKLGEYYWSSQQEICNSILAERYTAVKSCHDAGKSFIASRIVAWWLDMHPPGSAFVVTTAPTAAQVSAILWREISKAHKKGDLMGKITTAGYPQWKLADGELVGYGRKPADYDQSAFQGIHADYVLVIVDEACGVEANLFNAVDSIVTNSESRVLAIGNPDDPTSHFAEICKPDSGWNVIRIDGLRTPNFTKENVEYLYCSQCQKQGNSKTLLQRIMEEEGIAYNEEEVPDDLRPRLLSPIWVEERLHRWVGSVREDDLVSGVAAQSSLFTSKVRGLFPDSNTEGVIPLGWVERAMARGRDLADSGQVPAGRKVVGVDVADSGADETCLAIRRANSILEIRKYPNVDTMESTGYVTAAINEPHAIAIVDAIGVGAGVVSRLRELKMAVRAFVASKKAEGKKDATGEFTFTNMRSYAWWHLRELLDPSKNSTVTLPDDEMLKADLTSPRWKVLSGGKIQIELKTEIRKRLGRSPDAGDAVVQAFIVDSFEVDGDVARGGVATWWGGRMVPESRVMDFDGDSELDMWASDTSGWEN